MVPYQHFHDSILSMLDGPYQHFHESILSALRDVTATDLCRRQGVRGGPLLDFQGLHAAP